MAKIRPLIPPQVTPVQTTRFTRPPKVWGSLDVEGDMLVVRLKGWRVVWAAKRGLKVPLDDVIAVKHDPGVYQWVSTRWRISRRRTGVSLFRVGAYHGLSGWSFWSCGVGRNAIVIETTGRYRYIVVEVAQPEDVVNEVRDAARLKPPRRLRREVASPAGAAAARPVLTVKEGGAANRGTRASNRRPERPPPSA